jgi:hypothetical protein
MTRNQKIALGCGGAGCLGLIVVAVACVAIYFLAYRSSPYDRYGNYNYNSNRTANINRNSNENADDDEDSTNSSSANSSSSSSSTSDLSDDEKHKLFHAGNITGDYELQRRVWTKLGILESDFSQGDKFQEFGLAHAAWLVRNYQWVATIDTPEKGRAYVNEHLD